MRFAITQIYYAKHLNCYSSREILRDIYFETKFNSLTKSSLILCTTGSSIGAKNALDNFNENVSPRQKTESGYDNYT